MVSPWMVTASDLKQYTMFYMFLGGGVSWVFNIFCYVNFCLSVRVLWYNSCCFTLGFGCLYFSTVHFLSILFCILLWVFQAVFLAICFVFLAFWF